MLELSAFTMIHQYLHSVKLWTTKCKQTGPAPEHITPWSAASIDWIQHCSCLETLVLKASREILHVYTIAISVATVSSRIGELEQ